MKIQLETKSQASHNALRLVLPSAAQYAVPTNLWEQLFRLFHIIGFLDPPPPTLPPSKQAQESLAAAMSLNSVVTS